jgi:hypothetical protein
MNVAGMADDLKFLRQQGLIDNPDISIDNAVDASYAEEAAAQ